MKKNIIIALLSVAALAACNDSNEENPANLEPFNIFVSGSNTGTTTPPEYPVTGYSKIELSEAIQSEGAPTVYVTRTYDYASGRLTRFMFKQRFTAGYETTEIENISNVEYKDHQAIVVDEIGNVSTYTLNDNGYATACLRREAGGNNRSYTFAYLVNSDGKHFLKSITEILDGNSEPYSSINIDYNSYRSIHITEKIDDNEQSFTATTGIDNEIANTSEIHCLLLTDLYPLSLHTVALYGKILGDSYNTLITQIAPDNNRESNETTTYTYTLDHREIVTSCQEVINSYGANYVRTVNYSID